MGKVFITTLKGNIDNMDLPLYGFDSYFFADTEKNCVMDLDHARVHVIGTDKPCTNYITKEELGLHFSIEDATIVQFPAGNNVKIFLDLRNSETILGDEYSSKYFKGFHLRNIKNATKFIMGKDNNRLLDIDGIFDEELDLDSLLDKNKVTGIQLLANKTNSVKAKINVNNFEKLNSFFLSSRVDASNSYINIDNLPSSLKYIEYISGSINASGNIKNLAYVDMKRIQVIGSANIKGSLEEVIESMWSKGRRTGVVPILIEKTSATFNGSVPTFDTTAEFTSNGCNIYKSNSNSGSIIATYNGTSWSYN